MGIFLKDPSPYLCEYRRKPLKTPKGYVDKRDRGLNLAPPVYHFERRMAQQLVGLKTDSLTSMPYLGFEPGTFGAADGSSSHYTAWSANAIKEHSS